MFVINRDRPTLLSYVWLWPATMAMRRGGKQTDGYFRMTSHRPHLGGGAPRFSIFSTARHWWPARSVSPRNVQDQFLLPSLPVSSRDFLSAARTAQSNVFSLSLSLSLLLLSRKSIIIYCSWRIPNLVRCMRLRVLSYLHHDIYNTEIYNIYAVKKAIEIIDYFLSLPNYDEILYFQIKKYLFSVEIVLIKTNYIIFFCIFSLISRDNVLKKKKMSHYFGIVCATLPQLGMYIHDERQRET